MGLRKSAGISLEEVSNDINIPVIALEQIEAGTLGSFEDIYVLKRYLVDYAKYLGSDTDKVLKEFNDYIRFFIRCHPLIKILLTFKHR